MQTSTEGMSRREEELLTMVNVQFKLTEWPMQTKHRASVSAYALKSVLWILWAHEGHPIGYEQIAKKACMGKTTSTYCLTLLLSMGVISRRRPEKARAHMYYIKWATLSKYVKFIPLVNNIDRGSKPKFEPGPREWIGARA